MKRFELTHVASQVKHPSIKFTSEIFSCDRTIPGEDMKNAMNLEIGESCLLRFGNPMNVCTIIRYE